MTDGVARREREEGVFPRTDVENGAPAPTMG